MMVTTATLSVHYDDASPDTQKHVQAEVLRRVQEELERCGEDHGLTFQFIHSSRYVEENEYGS